MLKLKDEYYLPVDRDIQIFFYDTYYRPLLELIKEPLYNSRSAVLTAIRDGKIAYNNGVFTGKFTIAISKDLSKYAKFDSRSRTWKGIPPPDVKSAALIANSKSQKLHNKIKTLLNDLQIRIEETIGTLQFNIGPEAIKMDRQIQKDFSSIGIQPVLSDKIKENLIQDYNQNQTLNIKNWNEEQVLRLRDMIERSALEGYRRPNLIKMIESEWEVSKNKAKFLARQETSLFMSKLRRERNLDAGVRKYKWSTSHDERVRLDHKKLNGKIFFYGKPPVVDKRTGRRAEPGEDFGCRCVAIGVL